MIAIKLLSDGLITASECLVFRVGGLVLKVPLSLVAVRELKKERQSLIVASKDRHFSHYVPTYRYFWCVQYMPYFTALYDDNQSEQKIRRYFEQAFRDSHEWQETDLKNLIEYKYYMDFILTYSPDDLSFWEKFFCTAKMPQSSAHGDFHEGNILIKNNELLFIDWIDYRPQSSRYFDLFDYYIFTNKEKEVSWVDKWQKEFLENKTTSVQGVNISRTHATGYAIWRIAAELEMFTERQKMTEKKIRKYRDLIAVILSLYQNNELPLSGSITKE
jgi:hypothetical protein